MVNFHNSTIPLITYSNCHAHVQTTFSTNMPQPCPLSCILHEDRSMSSASRENLSTMTGLHTFIQLHSYNIYLHLKSFHVLSGRGLVGPPATPEKCLLQQLCQFHRKYQGQQHLEVQTWLWLHKEINHNVTKNSLNNFFLTNLMN